jgi:phosphotransferase system enzyme I (PtsP)
MAMIGLGFRMLSMPAAGIGPVKRMLMSLNGAEFAKILMFALQKGDEDMRQLLKKYATEHGVIVG